MCIRDRVGSGQSAPHPIACSGRRQARNPEEAIPPPMTDRPAPDDLQGLPTPALFRSAFGAQAQRQRLAEREKAQRQRQALEDLARRRAYLDGLRARG